VRLIILLIVLIMSLIAASAILPCLIATIKVFLKFGALTQRPYCEIIRIQILKTIREEKYVVRELRRCDERVYMFQCSDNIYYVHTRARYILQSHSPA
jgi:hypothetical protein